MHLDSTVVKSGFFFTPQNPEKRYPGVVTIADGGRISLEITADEVAFVELDEMFIGKLIGQVEGGYVTLEDCEYRSMNMAFGGVTGKSQIYARLIYVGTVGLPEPINFTTLRFRVENLSEWLGKSAFKMDFGANYDECTITMERPEPVKCILPDNTQLLIGVHVKVPGATKYPTIELYQEAFLEITPATPQPIEFYQGLSHRLTRFFSFVIGKPVAIHSLIVQIDDSEIDEIHRSLDVYFESLNNSSNKQIKSREMLLQYSNIASRLEDLLSNWLNQYEILKPAIHHYFTVQDETHAYMDTKFLAMAQALEAFHRRTSNTQIKSPKDEYKAKTDAILKSTPDEFKAFLKDQMMFGNEISFATRLHQLLDRFSNVFGGQSNADLMIQGTVRTRNYHAHYDPKGAAKALKGSALVILTLRLRVLFALNLLTHLGLEEDESIRLTKALPLSQLLRNATYIEQNSD